MREVFTPDELAGGWRLACRGRITSDITLEIEQWTTPVLADSTHVPFEPTPGRIIAVDIGTTTIAAQLVDGATGEVLAVETGLNPQAAFGADLMTRIEYDVRHPGRLTDLIRDYVTQIARRAGPARELLLCGNTVMQHLFCGASVESLSHVPFDPALHGTQQTAQGTFLCNLGGFVGSDILAGIIATRLHEASALVALIDLGTNGEIVVGNRDRLLCASTAAGPAFEAGRIRMGMRAAEGAISHVSAHDGRLQCHIIGDTAPRGICGSGLVDAVAAGLDLGLILPNGRFANGARELPIAGSVLLTQSDIRELQLAKGAIAAGLRMLTAKLGVTPADLQTVYLAGAFGNYVEVDSAVRIGLLEVDPAHVVPSGNTALRGTKIIALSPSRREFFTEELPKVVEHVPLASDPTFQNTFVNCLKLTVTTFETSLPDRI
jgi:uncharacterized 2Fe-2S/4Fe-4S cluster protein (DUF4445 family)